ncbi:MAG: hypothetical protein JSU77_13575 [Fidelibacterota bacterium]|nr:MAG: hypothetical protein JSU77_13575 [Candidatus Neomarinimicrobiota bacterium]
MRPFTRGISLFFISLLVSLNSCVVYQEGGPAIYDATASSDEGKKFVEKYNVKYICENVVSILFADLSRSESGVFAVDVELTKEGKIQFRQVSGEFVLIYGLEPKFSWWHNHGIWIAIPLVIIISVLSLLITIAVYKIIFGSA